MKEELPRKEAVRAVLGIINRHRKVFTTEIRGRHREIANVIVDKCEQHTHESKYVTRFLVTEKAVIALVKHQSVAELDLVTFAKWCSLISGCVTRGEITSWESGFLGYVWNPV